MANPRGTASASCRDDRRLAPDARRDGEQAVLLAERLRATWPRLGRHLQPRLFPSGRRRRREIRGRTRFEDACPCASFAGLCSEIQRGAAHGTSSRGDAQEPIPSSPGLLVDGTLPSRTGTPKRKATPPSLQAGRADLLAPPPEAATRQEAPRSSSSPMRASLLHLAKALLGIAPNRRVFFPRRNASLAHVPHRWRDVMHVRESIASTAHLHGPRRDVVGHVP